MTYRTAIRATLAGAMFFIGLLLFAETPKIGPTIPDSILARFWKAQSNLEQKAQAMQKANQEFKDAQKSMGDVVSEMKTFCGDKYQPQLNQTGDPVCEVLEPRK